MMNEAGPPPGGTPGQIDPRILAMVLQKMGGLQGGQQPGMPGNALPLPYDTLPVTPGMNLPSIGIPPVPPGTKPY